MLHCRLPLLTRVREISLSVGLVRLGPDRPGLKLALSLQFGVMQSAGVAERPGSIGSTSPFRSVDSVAAVASAGRSGAPSSLLDFCDTVLGLHSIPVHIHIVLLFVWPLHLGAFSSSLVLNRGLHQVPHLLQRSLDELNVTEHIRHFTFCGQSCRDGVGAMLFLRDSAVGFRKVENRARRAANPTQRVLIAPALEVSIHGSVISSTGGVVRLLSVCGRSGVVRSRNVRWHTVSGRNRISGQRHLTRR